jgi:hypothetical protein
VNRPRIAALLRELADELERDDAPANDAPKAKRPRRRSVPLVKPTGRGNPSELDMARADALIRKHYGR